MFTSQGIKSVNISKNKVLTNNSELTVTDAFIEGLFYKIFSSSIQGSNSMVSSWAFLLLRERPLNITTEFSLQTIYVLDFTTKEDFFIFKIFLPIAQVFTFRQLPRNFSQLKQCWTTPHSYRHFVWTGKV